MTKINGVDIVTVPMKERKSVAVGIWVKVGGRHEEPRLGGVSHFLEHIVFKGTPKRTANQIKESVEGVGGSLNAFTGEEYTCFLAKVSHRFFPQVFEVLADMVFNASLDDAEIKKERSVILEEIKMTQDQPAQLADELLSEIVWPEHALGRPLAGTVESVSALSRQDIWDYKQKFYVPSLITVVAAGAIEKPLLTRLIRQTFPSKCFRETKKTVAPFKPSLKSPRTKFLSKSTEQMHLALGLHSYPKNHPSEPALDILNILLGGNMSSRLFNEVREERGLAYDIGSFTKKYHETGAFVVEAGVDHKKTKEAIDVILKELRKVASQLVSTDELDRAKEFYLGQLELSLENTMNRMLWVGENILTLDKYQRYEAVRARIQKVTPDDLQQVARELFKPQALHLAAVGPKALDLEKDFHHFLSII